MKSDAFIKILRNLASSGSMIISRLSLCLTWVMPFIILRGGTPNGTDEKRRVDNILPER